MAFSAAHLIRVDAGSDWMNLLARATRELGFSSAAVIPAAPSKRLSAYLDWVDREFHGAMGYLARPDRIARRRDLHEILPGVQSIICVVREYAAHGPSESMLSEKARGRIAAYAWETDYHDTMLPQLEALAEVLEGESHLAYVDTGAILERDHADSAGLGFTGKNTMLISPRRGSWCFLGQILTTAEISPTPVAARLPSCGTCSRCLTACPTDAFPEPYVLDARRCISYLTIELKGAIPIELRRKMGNWVFGCDDCQTVCPFNRFSDLRTDVSLDAAAPPLTQWLTLSREEFESTYRGTPLYRTGRDRLVRNACVAAGNSGSESLVEPLAALLRTDASPLVRQHAAWALGRFGERTLLNQAHRAENAREVVQEIDQAMLGPRFS